ncbi:unnamed protein product [Urochloa decumbens]|uniref:Ubiquitinyl hydrolase 1 n=1 Tax=Urochloa decumbens TaxID=240449 RepID=A0ABC9GSW6_9POAL
MGKKMPPKGELEESPRKAKVPRLDPLALAAAAPAPEASNLMEEGAEGTSANNRCNHVPADSAHTRLSSSLLSEDAGRCVGCRREDEKGRRYRKQRPLESSILMCLECGRHLCCGVGGIEYPFGHSRAHAMKKQHWVAVLYDDAEKGYCFKCNAEVGMPAKFEVDGHVIGIDVIRDVVGSLPKHLLQPLPGVMGHKRPRLEVVEMTGKIQAEGLASVSGVVPGPISGLQNLGYEWHSHELGSANTQGYAIKGIPNIANTCYMNAILQCLLALDKLRARLLEPDTKGPYALALKELFEETSAAGGLLKPHKFFKCVCTHNRDFIGGLMHDSHELLSSLLKGLNEEMETPNLERQITVPTFIDSIFGFELSQTLYCKCGSKSVTHPFFHDLQLALPSKGHLIKSVASPQTRESLKSRQMSIAVQLSPAHEQTNLEKMQTIAESGDFHLGSELKEAIVEETPKPLEVDFTDAQRTCQSKDVVLGPLQTQENKVSRFELPQRIIEVPVKPVSFLPHNVSDLKNEEMDEMTQVVSIEDCLLLFHEEVIFWRCDNCAKEHGEARANQSKNCEQIVGDQTEQSDRTVCSNEKSSGLSSLSVECKSSSNIQPHASDEQSQITQTVGRITEGTSSGMSCGEKDSTARSITNKEPELQHNKFRATNSEDFIKQLKMHQDMTKQLELDGSHQLKDITNEQEDNVGDAIQTNLFKKLPSVLTIQLKRGFTCNEVSFKMREHVRFKEYLDVGRFMDPSSVDKDNSLYRLAGVVEHRDSNSLDTGHYVAYVRARRLGNQQQQSSCSSSWFCANDRDIREVTLEEVLMREAYILFYESVEG